MSDKQLARRTKLKVFFDNVDISTDVNKYLSSLTYTDNAEDETDDIQIKLCDKDDIWLTKWLNAVAETAPAIASETVGMTPYKVSAQSGVSIRSGPGTGYSKIVTLPYNSAVKVKNVNNGWATIIYSDQTAYVTAASIARDDADSDKSSVKGSTGIKIQAAIIRENRNSDGRDDVLDTGEFELDGIDISGAPSVINIKGTSLSYASGVRQEKKNKAWEKYSLSKIAAEISSISGMTSMFEATTDPYYARVEQVDTSDIVFLQKLCKNAGLSLKVTSNIIVLFDEATYEGKAAVRTIIRGGGGYLKYKLNMGENDTQYGSCHVSYTDPASGKTIEGTYKDKASKEDAQTLEITERVTSISEAQSVAMKRLRQKNKFAKTADFTLPGDTGFVAGVTVQLDGWGFFSGKYIVSQARHSIGSSGYTTSIKLRNVLEGY
ncbi:MAG: SH3 domain-containing protein [Oscillospiraceae bacterium]